MRWIIIMTLIIGVYSISRVWKEGLGFGRIRIRMMVGRGKVIVDQQIKEEGMG